MQPRHNENNLAELGERKVPNSSAVHIHTGIKIVMSCLYDVFFLIHSLNSLLEAVCVDHPTASQIPVSQV